MKFCPPKSDRVPLLPVIVIFKLPENTVVPKPPKTVLPVPKVIVDKLLGPLKELVMLTLLPFVE